MKVNLGATVTDLIKAVNSIDSTSEWVEYTADSTEWVQKTIPNPADGSTKTYWALAFSKSDTSVEMYNMDGEKIFCGTYQDNNYIYLCVVDKIDCKIRKIQTPSNGTNSLTNYMHDIIIHTALDLIDLATDLPPEYCNISEYLTYTKPTEDDDVYDQYTASANGKVLEIVIRFQCITTRATPYLDYTELVNNYGSLIFIPFNVRGYVKYSYTHKLKWKHVSGGMSYTYTTEDYEASSIRIVDGFTIASGVAQK